MFFRARSYDQSSGHFISRDPAGFVDGLSLYPSYFELTDSDPFGLWTFELGPNGEIWILSEGNTLADLVPLGYDPSLLLALSPCGNLDEWIPAGSKFDISSFLPKSVRDSCRHQQQQLITKENLAAYLRMFFELDFENFTLEEVLNDLEDSGCNRKKWERICRSVIDGNGITCGEAGFYDVDLSTVQIVPTHGQCYDFAALGLGIRCTEVGQFPWDVGFSYVPNEQTVFLDDRMEIAAPEFNCIGCILRQ